MLPERRHRTIRDISVRLCASMPGWPGAGSPIHHSYTSRIADGAPRNTSRISISLHAGTHIDAPFHCDDNGATCDKIPLDRMIGKAVVYDLTHVERCIEAAHFDDHEILIGHACLFKTRNSELWKENSFSENFVTIHPEVARMLAEKDVPLVGIDYLSVDPCGSDDSPAHRAFLNRGIVVLEGINLSDVQPKSYELICLPMKITDAEAAPVRAVLIE